MSRMFPKPSRNALTSFIHHTLRMERIPASPQDIDQVLKGASSNPWIEGQFKAVNVVISLASNPDLLPQDPPDSHRQALDQLVFLRQLHLNQFRLVSEHAQKLQDPTIIDSREVGAWRSNPHFVGSTEMPNPVQIPFLLHDWWKDLIAFHNQYRHKIETPGLLEQDDLTALVQKAYQSHLQLACIKPFQDGSNRTARLVENLLRLNWGLPWKITRHEDEFKIPYVNDLKQCQKSFLT